MFIAETERRQGCLFGEAVNYIAPSVIVRN